MNSKFEIVKRYYELGLWSKKRVYNAVGKWITKEDYKIIVGEAYV
jgi:hypothetical protein